VIDRRIEDEIKIILTYGGFEHEEIAIDEGKKLYFSVKKQFIKKGIPINISGGLGVLDTSQTSFITGEVTQYGLDNIHLLFPELKDKTVRNEILGMEIYYLEEDISKVKFIGQSIKATKIMKFPEIIIEDHKVNDKINTAYSLLNSSNAINDLRASFLLKISSIESLVIEDSYKDEVFCDVINHISKKLVLMDNIKGVVEVSDSELQEVIQKIKGSFGNLKKKSIGEKCRDLIESCKIQKEYLGMNVMSFFNDCYRLRSEFVHTGTYKGNISETQKIRELENYTHELDKLIIDILEYYEKNFV
jgi:hypothetical protein